MVFRNACLACLLLVSACGRKETRPVRSGVTDPPAFWVWHRSSGLKPAESASLEQAGVRSLFWEVAEFSWDHAWHMTRIAAPIKDTAKLQITPVFRIQPESAFLGAPDAARLLADQIHKWSGRANAPERIQLDFDCPARLLGDYTRFLIPLGQAMSPTRISITALASWPRNPGFQDLAKAVDSLAPMFYDLKADDPADVKAGRYQPMADRSVADLIKLWADCPRPWLAGLPDFERLSVFDAAGKLTGHLRGWTHDPVFFNPDLKLHASGDGVTVFETRSPTEVSSTLIPAGGKLVHRMPDASALADLAEVARQAGARGILYFALPGPGIQAAYSPGHLTHAAEAPQPVLGMGTKNTLVLSNPGPADLPARRWELEISSKQPGAFQSASPGGFATSGGPGGIPAEIAGTIVLGFSRLQIGESITSGPMIRNASGLTWRIRKLTANQPLDSVNSAR